MTSSITELEDTFLVSTQSQKLCRLTLTSNDLSIIQLNNSTTNAATASSTAQNVRVIPIDEIYGCLCMKPAKHSNQCHLVIFLYALRRSHSLAGIFSKKLSLHRSKRVFTYAKYDDYDRNSAEVTLWHRNITEAIYLKRNLPLDIVNTKRGQRTIVFVNPAGGAGKAYRFVMEYCVAVWSEAEFPHQIMVTEYAGHARDFVQAMELNDCAGIVVASGDGLVYEVINGLLSRPDWQEALKVPIGHLPCGSGNAFIANIILHSKQPIASAQENFVVQSAVMIATHQVVPFDMAVMDTCDGQRLFSFLTLEWAIIADVDCDSEKYRFLGGTRFTVEAVKRIIRPRIYPGYIDYLPYDKDDEPVRTNPITPETTTAQLYHHLPPMNEPISIDPAESKWRRIEGPFSHVLISSKAAISKDTISTPQSTLTDGYLTLQYMLARDGSRANLAKAFTGLADGKHFDYDFVHWLPIRAFRLVPNNTDGNLMVDGEKVPYGPIQGEILPSFARCMGKQPKVQI